MDPLRPNLNLACRFAENLIVMSDGAIVIEEAKADIMTLDLVLNLFDLDSNMLPDPVSDTPIRRAARPAPPDS